MYGAHGPWCNTRTFLTKCSTCGISVYFFQCDHESKVFFDALGSPWPVHDCDTSWTRKLKRTTDKTGKISVQIAEGITVTRVPDTFRVDKTILDRLHLAKKSTKPEPFVAVEPEDNSSRCIVGILRELTCNVDPIKKFGIGDTAMGLAMLGPLGEQEMGRVTVHVPLPTEQQAESFTLWIPSALIADPVIITGLTVSLGLESINTPRGYVWFCDQFDVLR